MPFDLISGVFVPTRSNIWRDACDGQYDWLQEHLREGAPLNEADLCGDPPLLLAAGNGERSPAGRRAESGRALPHNKPQWHTPCAGHVACMRLLMREGADIEQRNVMRETPLIRAAHNGHLSAVRELIARNADVNAIDLGDNTALHWAAMRGHVEVCAALLQAGARTDLKNLQGHACADLCQPQWSHAWRYTRALLSDPARGR